MANSKLTGLTEIGALGTDDLLYVVEDPAGAPASRKITVAQLLADLGLPRVLATASPSGVSEVDFTLPIGYAEFEICGWMIPATNAVRPYIRFDDGGGFDETNEYWWAGHHARIGLNDEVGADNTAGISLGTLEPGSAANEGVWFSVRIRRAKDSAHTLCEATGGAHNDSNDTYYATYAAGRHKVASSVDAARIVFSSGNIASGELRLIGYP